MQQNLSLISPNKKQLFILEMKKWNFPGSSVVKDSALSLQGAQVRSLVGELRSHPYACTTWPKKKKNRRSFHAVYKLKTHTIPTVFVSIAGYVIYPLNSNSFTIPLNIQLLKDWTRNFPGIQCLAFHVSTAGCSGSIPGRGTSQTAVTLTSVTCIYNENGKVKVWKNCHSQEVSRKDMKLDKR